MFNWLKTFFAGNDKQQFYNENDSDSLSKAIDQLSEKLKELKQPLPESVQLKENYLFLRLLYEVAFADLEISEDERKKIKEILSKKTGYGQETLDLFIAEVEREVKKGMGVYKLASEFSALTAEDQRLKLLSSLFEVAASDSTISNFEEKTIKQIIEIMRLNRQHFYQLKIEFRDKIPYLNCLK